MTSDEKLLISQPTAEEKETKEAKETKETKEERPEVEGIFRDTRREQLRVFKIF